jgi:hypothetical protein
MATVRMIPFVKRLEEVEDNICTGCPTCSDRDTCEASCDEDLAFEALPEEEDEQ